MPRNHPTAVHRRLSALMQAGHLTRPPPAYQALSLFPPRPLPPRQPSHRSGTAGAHRTPVQASLRSARPQPISFASLDKLRRAFFRDHPFEAHRPTSLIEHSSSLASRVLEQDEVRRLLPDGSLGAATDVVPWHEWTELRQRSCNPNPEDCIAFAHVLHTRPEAPLTLNLAYHVAVSQYRTLKSEADTAASFARQEAEGYGAVWERSQLNRYVELQAQWLKDQTGMSTPDPDALTNIHVAALAQPSMTPRSEPSPPPFTAGATHLVDGRAKQNRHYDP